MGYEDDDQDDEEYWRALALVRSREEDGRRQDLLPETVKRTPGEDPRAAVVVVVETHAGLRYVRAPMGGSRLKTSWCLAGAYLFQPSDRMLPHVLEWVATVEKKRTVRTVDVMLAIAP